MIEINHIYEGDCLNVLRGFPENSIDSIVTDPPYGLSFMGKKWDYDVPSQAVWEECLRVLKPGGHLLAFAGTRTQHRMAVRIEDAGFEIRDMIAWIYGSGFPKSLNIGKAVDKLQGNEREIVAVKEQSGAKFKTAQEQMDNGGFNDPDRTEFSVDKGTSEWEGWGTALKPALEPITVARKPISEKTIAENVLKWNTGGINIDGCRVDLSGIEEHKTPCKGKLGKNGIYGSMEIKSDKAAEFMRYNSQGRFPANLIHDGSEEVLSGFPETKSGTLSPNHQRKLQHNPEHSWGFKGNDKGYQLGKDYGGDSGSASRFFYCAKASKSERNEGCEGLEEKNFGFSGGANSQIEQGNEEYLQDHIGLNRITKMRNNHPTVKPIALMEYLVKLVTPRGGIVLDPFTGSGSTLIAAEKLGFNYIGIELNPEYIQIANARLAAKTQLRLSI